MGAQYGGQHGPLNVNAVTSQFRTDGYRDHSAARRDHAHGKFKLDAGSAGTFTLIADALDQPETQDPLGAHRGAGRAEPARRPPRSPLAFNTRKSISQNQVGLVHDLKLGARDALQARVYGGDRQVTQYLAIPLATQAAATSLRRRRRSRPRLTAARGCAGVAPWSSGGPLDFHVGVDYERMAEHRRGFINTLGIRGRV